MAEYPMLEEQDDDEYEEVIIGKDGDYEVDPDGTIILVKKPPGEEGGGGKGEGEGEDGEGEEKKDDEIPEGEGGWDKIDEQAKKVEERIKQGTDLGKDEVEQQKKEEEEAKAKAKGDKAGKKGGRGSGEGNAQKLDYANEKPQYKWDQLIKLFVGRPKEITEPSYARMGRGSITGLDMARQIGAGAPKPGEVKFESKQMDLVFCVDSSGSMMSVIAKVFANIVALLGRKEFDKSIFTLFKFSTKYKIYKGSFIRDAAEEISPEQLFKRPPSFTDKMSRVFKDHDMNATNFGPELANHLIECVNKGFNVLIFSDQDVASGGNGDELARVLRSKPGKVFMLFDTRSSWVHFKNNYQILTPNVSYIENDD